MRRENVYRKILVFSIILWFGELSYSQEATYKIIENIPYSLINDEYAKERCKLDLYYPENLKGCPTCSLVSWRRIDRWKQAFTGTIEK